MLYRDYLKTKTQFEFVPNEMKWEHREMLYDFLEEVNETNEYGPFKTRACIGCKNEKSSNNPYRCDGCQKASRYESNRPNKRSYKDYIRYDIETTKALFNKFHNENGQFGLTKLGAPAGINKVIFNDPATIVLWSDGTKTVVKCQENDFYDPEKGLAMAIAKKALGNQGNYYNEIKKWVDPWYEEQEKINEALTFNRETTKLWRGIMDRFWENYQKSKGADIDGERDV